MDKRTKAYVDTSALIAFLDKSDTFFSLFCRLFSDPPKLITTPLVISEGQGWFLKRYDANRANQFMNFIEALTPLSIVAIDESHIASATNILRKYSDQKLTLVDAVGLQLMREQKIKICWSTDRHLTLLGSRLVTEVV